MICQNTLLKKRLKFRRSQTLSGKQEMWLCCTSVADGECDSSKPKPKSSKADGCSGRNGYSCQQLGHMAANCPYKQQVAPVQVPANIFRSMMYSTVPFGMLQQHWPLCKYRLQHMLHLCNKPLHRLLQMVKGRAEDWK